MLCTKIAFHYSNHLEFAVTEYNFNTGHTNFAYLIILAVLLTQ